jgi:hypothetical protein
MAKLGRSETGVDADEENARPRADPVGEPARARIAGLSL